MSNMDDRHEPSAPDNECEVVPRTPDDEPTPERSSLPVSKRSASRAISPKLLIVASVLIAIGVAGYATGVVTVFQLLAGTTGLVILLLIDAAYRESGLPGVFLGVGTVAFAAVLMVGACSWLVESGCHR
jgi:hypothetical protein